MTLVWKPGWNGLTEPEAVSYVAAVEAADGQELEFGVAKAINDFVLGCKNDGILSAIKASCILAGARTLTGALVPLVGTAPTNVGGLFVSGDYNRKTGLVGDGSTKYLNSNRNNNADPQNSKHLSAYVSSAPTSAVSFLMGAGIFTTGGNSSIIHESTGYSARANVGGSDGPATIATTITSAPAFVAISRTQSNSQNARINSSTFINTRNSAAPANANLGIFASIQTNSSPTLFSDARLAFYSIGESLDLALLDARVTDLINAFGAAIP